MLNEYLDGKKTHQVVDSDEKTDPVPAKDSGFFPQLEPAVPVVKMGDLCPECGEATMVNEEGCRKCYSCGYSEC